MIRLGLSTLTGSDVNVLADPPIFHSALQVNISCLSKQASVVHDDLICIEKVSLCPARTSNILNTGLDKSEISCSLTEPENVEVLYAMPQGNDKVNSDDVKSPEVLLDNVRNK